MADFDEVFKRLKGILELYGERLVVTVNKPGHYYLESSYSEKWKKALFFGSAQIQKNYVSFYLMPVYMFPELLEGISPGLKKRMQGKSCFNFKGVDEVAFAELANLTKKGLEKFEKEVSASASA
jgi:hypothetical protein